jgi:putative component of toxin-antitoxin plasmid stabilization module
MATTITIYGASDDLIEVDGDIREEFTYLDRGNDGDLLACSDGTILRIEFGEVWRITPVVHGSAALTIAQAPENDDKNYTDRATLTGDIVWVVQGIAWAGGGGRG